MTRNVAKVSVVDDGGETTYPNPTFAFGAGAARVLETITGFLAATFFVRHGIQTLRATGDVEGVRGGV